MTNCAVACKEPCMFMRRTMLWSVSTEEPQLLKTRGGLVHLQGIVREA
jgi:hypothetical protein